MKRRSRSRGLVTSALTRRSWWVLAPILIIAAALVLLPPILIPAAAVWASLRRRPDRLVALLTAVCALPLAALVVALGVDYGAAWAGMFRALFLGDALQVEDAAGVAAWSVGVGPIVGAAWWRVDLAWRESQPMAGPDERARRVQVESARRSAMVHRVQGAAYDGDDRRAAIIAWAAGRLAVPLTARGLPIVGVLLAGDLRWPRTRRGLVAVPRDAHHVVVLGTTGTGKSELIWRLLEPVIKAGHAQVIYLNAKQPGPGDEPSVRLAALAEQYGRTSRLLIRDRMMFDPMRGSPDRVRQRLLATEQWSEPYYRAASALLLGLALDLHAGTGSPLQTLPDLVWSLKRDRLAELAEGDERAAELVKLFSDPLIEGAVLRWAAQALTLRGWIGTGASGFSWEDGDVVGVDLPTSSEPDAAIALLRMMLTDLEGWLTDSGRRPDRPLVLVIEELSALDADPILGRRVVNLMERARSAGVRFILAAQDPGGLGDDRAQAAVLSNAAVITGQQTDGDAVERLVTLAGTRRAAEASEAYRGLHLVGAGEGSVRMQDQFAVSPNLLRELPRGEAVVIHRGRWAHLGVAMARHGYRVPVTPRLTALRAALAASRAAAEAMPPVDVPTPQTATGRRGVAEER